MPKHVTHDLPDDLLRLHLVGSVPTEEICESLDTERLPARCVGLDHAVGVEEHAVARLEGFRRYVRLDLGCQRSQAPRRGGTAVQLANDVATSDQEGQGMPGVRPGHRAGIQVDLHELPG